MATENFSGLGAGADLSTLSGWAQRSGSIVGATGGGVASPGGSGDSIYAYTVGSFSANQWSASVFGSSNPSSGLGFIGPAVRVTAGGACWAAIAPANPSANLYLNRYNAGSFTGEAYVVAGPAIGQLVTLSIEDIGSGNSRLRVYYDNALVLTQDVSTGPASGQPGLAAYGNGFAATADNWLAGNLPRYIAGEALASTGSSSSTSRSFAAANHVSGGSIVVGTSNFNNGGDPKNVLSVTDTAGNTYTKKGATSGGSVQHKLELWVANNIVGDAANVITITYESPASYFTSSYAHYDSGLTYESEAPAVLTSSGLTHISGQVSVTGPAFLVGFSTDWDGGAGGISSAVSSSLRLVASAQASVLVDRLVTSPGDYSTGFASTSSAGYAMLTRAFRSTSPGTSDLSGSYAIESSTSSGSVDLAAAYAIESSTSSGSVDLAAAYVILIPDVDTAPFTFDGANKIITVDVGVTSFTAAQLWSRWADWVAHLDNARFLPAMRHAGGDDLGGGLSIPNYIFLLNGWRVRPYEGNHNLNITGNLFVEGGGVPVIGTIGAFNVSVQYTVPVQAQGISTSGSTGPTAAEIAAAVWAHVSRTVNVEQMNSAEVIGDGTEGNPWRGVGVPP